MTTNYDYKPNTDWLNSVLHQLGASTIDGATYTLDAAGNRSTKTDQLALVTSNYTYDEIYQLKNVTQGATTTETYTYDPVGNRLSSLGLSPYVYNNPSNRLDSTPNASYAYDNNGNILTKTETAGVTNYTWDYENRLASATLPGAGGTVFFKYDSFGRRVQKVSSAATSIFVYDRVNQVEEVNAAGAVVARYAQGLDIDQPLAMLRSAVTSYYHADGLGSVTSLSNTAGALAQTYTFDSFGKQTASSGALTNPFRYTAREFDFETNLYFYRARYYDPNVGRFISEDPLGFDGEHNFYTYTRNSPIGFKDPLGLYTLQPHVPPPSAALDTFLKCMDRCVKVPVDVSATTNGVHADRGHALGTSVDIKPPAGLPADSVFCCGGKCGAPRGLNEDPANGGGSLPTTTGANYHFSLVQYVKHPTTPSAIPDRPECKPGGCPDAKP